MRLVTLDYPFPCFRLMKDSVSYAVDERTGHFFVVKSAAERWSAQEFPELVRRCRLNTLTVFVKRARPEYRGRLWGLLSKPLQRFGEQAA